MILQAKHRTSLLMIDTNSPTWKSVLRWIEAEQADAVAYLIRDMDSEQQRGALKVLDKLKDLPNPQDSLVVTDDYS